MGKTSAPVWKAFSTEDCEIKFAKCLYCGELVSRGSDDPRKQNTTNLNNHMKKELMKEWNEINLQLAQNDSAGNPGPSKRPADEEIQINNLRTKKDRTNFLQISLKDSIDMKKVWEFKDARAQKLHKSVFDNVIIMDLQPFNIVNKPGFIRHMAIMEPRFQLGSDFYYRSLLDPTYEKIKAKLRNQIKSDKPKCCAVSMDAWSAFHHGYMGINVHYISNFTRKMYNLACSPFDDSHTGVNIWNLLRDVLEEWEILVITTVALRDGARNMINAFQQPGCYIIDIHCLIHVIQLVINGQVLSMASVKKLIELVNSIVSHAQMSNVFYAELWKQEELQMLGSDQMVDKTKKKKNLVAKNDTRWNSIYLMLARFLELKLALIPTIAIKLPEKQLTSADWNLMEKVVKSLEPFEKATRYLSNRSTHIGCSIPVVTTIINDLKVTNKDFGIMTMKRGLKEAMEEKFKDLEYNEKFTIATFLDPRFKHKFFRNKETLANVRATIHVKLIEQEEMEILDTPVVVEEDKNSKISNSFEDLISNIATKTTQHGTSANHKNPIDIILDEYCDAPVIPITDDPLMFWKEWSESGNPLKQQFSDQAVEHITPPGTSVDLRGYFPGLV